MTIDPDILAIRRRRRQAGRCVACGMLPERSEGRPSVLCQTCAKTLAYCPQCEQLYERRASLKQQHTSEYCGPCRAAHARQSGRHLSWTEHLARQQARRRALLPEIIRLRLRGQTKPEIGRALGFRTTQIARFIRSAKERGEWPEELRRGEGKERTIAEGEHSYAEL